MLKRKNLCFALAAVLVIVMVAAAVFAWHYSKPEDIFQHDELCSAVELEDDGYKLEQMLIVSRHNIRSPLSTGDSLLGQITPHEWFSWTSEAGELSVKGGQLETAMGQFFRKYLEAKGFMPANWIPEDGEVRFYSNSLQRTIATAAYFANGMLPVANTEIEYHEAYGEVDPLFCPIIRYITPEFEAQVRSEISEFGGDEGMEGIGRELKEAYTLLEEFLDFKDSEYAKENMLDCIPTDDTEIELTVGAEVKLTGGLKTACSAVDAMKLQIYEEQNLNKALFGHKLTEDEIRKICEIGDVYQDVCEGSKTLAMQVMHPMIGEMKNELMTPERKFTFLCGHDSTITALVSALGIENYELPGIISCKAPIGGKMVFEKYSDAGGQEYVRLFMCYNTTAQLRSCAITSLDDPPMFYELEFEGLDKNADGYYRYEDILARFDEVLEHYYDFCEEDLQPAA